MSGRQHGEAYRRLRSAERPSVCAGLSRCGVKCKAAEVAIITALLMSMTSASDRTARRLPAFWRWLGIAFRAVHLGAVVLLGTTLLGAAPRVPGSVVGVVLLATGTGLLALEVWKTPGLLGQFAGAGTILKLAFVLWMVLDAAHAEAAFWLVVLWSVVFAHAPASFRHRRIGALWDRPGPVR